jgi:hypothetical protein
VQEPEQDRLEAELFSTDPHSSDQPVRFLGRPCNANAKNGWRAALLDRITGETPNRHSQRALPAQQREAPA